MRPSLLSLLCVRTASLYCEVYCHYHFSYWYKATQILTSLWLFFWLLSIPCSWQWRNFQVVIKTVGNSAMSTKISLSQLMLVLFVSFMSRAEVLSCSCRIFCLLWLLNNKKNYLYKHNIMWVSHNVVSFYFSSGILEVNAKKKANQVYYA